MKDDMKPFVAIEGINGAGKSYTRDLLEQHFKDLGAAPFLLGQYGWLAPEATAVIVAFRERWGGYGVDELLRAHVVDRRATYAQVIEPNLRRVPVIGDRSLISDGPYLEALEGVPAEDIIDLYRREGLRFPTLTVFVDFDSQEAVRRIDQRGQGRKEYETEEILKAVSESYRRIVRNGALAACTSVIEVSGHEPHTVLTELDRLLLSGADR